MPWVGGHHCVGVGTHLQRTAEAKVSHLDAPLQRVGWEVALFAFEVGWIVEAIELPNHDAATLLLLDKTTWLTWLSTSRLADLRSR